MLDQNILHPSKSSFASPIVLEKQRQHFEIMHRLSKRIEETSEALSGAIYFSALDLSHGYFQVLMDEGLIYQTEFRVP